MQTPMRSIGKTLKVAALLLLPAFGAADQTLTIHADEARLVPLLSHPTHFFLDDPDLADLSLLAPTQIMILAHKPGHTVLHVLGDTGTAIATIDLDIEPARTVVEAPAELKPIAVAIEPNRIAILPLLAEGSRVFVNDPTIAAVIMTSPEELQVTGKSPGRTLVYALDDRSITVGLFDVTVGGASGARTPPIPSPPALSAVSTAVQIEVDEARLLDLPQPASSATADDKSIAGTRVQPPAKLLVYGTAPGRTYVRARDDTGTVVAIVRVDVAPTTFSQPDN